MGVFTEIVEATGISLPIWAAFAAILVSLYQLIVFPIYFHPLSGIPGPHIACITKYWILYKTWAEQRNVLVHDLHLKYGPIVRIGPNEIDISDADYLKDIYVNNFNKSGFYSQFGWYGQLNTFSTVTKNEHRDSRKVSNKYYSKTTVTGPDIEPMVKEVISDVLKEMDLGKSESFEVYNLFQAMAMDVVAGFSFGKNTAKSIVKDQEERDRLLNAFRLQSSMWFWTTLLPKWRQYALSDEIVAASTIARDWIKSSFDASLDVKDTLEKKTLAGVLVAGGKSNDQAASEIGDHIAAGHQTTGIAMAYILWELSEPKHKHIQKKLRDELNNHFGKIECNDIHNIPEYKSIDQLPYLNAVINEGLRVHAPIPGEEPRIAPSEGFTWRGSKETPMSFIPGGTLVTMQPHSLHRNSVVFPEPEAFDPERWLTEDPVQLREMNRHIMTFGAGIRMCIGMNLALEEMKFALTAIYTRYSSSLDPNFDYNDKMQMVDKYTTHPKGHECYLIFNPLK